MNEENNPDEVYQIFNQNVYQQEEVEKIAIEVIESVLMNQQFNEQKVPIWINQICEKVVQNLVELQKPSKYIVNCMIQQRNGAGAIISASCYWDTSCDGALIYQWPKDKQAKDAVKITMQCILVIYQVCAI